VTSRLQVVTWGVVVVLLVAAMLRVVIAWQPVQVLLKVNLPDDAYYYFTIARNMLNGDGVTLDGIHANNGFHPLWLLLILPLFSFEQVASDLPIHLALSLGALLDVVTCYLLYCITVHLTGKREAGLVCAAFYALDVVPVLQATNGLETALGGVLAAGCWLGALALASKPTVVRALGWGTLVGLALLARTDNALLAISLGIYLLAVRRDRVGWLTAIVAVVASILVVSPWLIWNQVKFGSPMQVSGVAVPYAIHARHQIIHGGSTKSWIQGALGSLLYGSLWLRGDFTGSPPLVGPILWLFAVAGLAVAWKRGNRSGLWACVPTTAAALGLVMVHTLVRWYPRPWYFITSAHALSVGLGAGVVELAAAWPGWQRLALTAGIVALSVVIVWSGVSIWHVGLYPWQDRMLEAADWIGHNVPEGEMVGSLNAGLYAYYSGRTVVNLDGVVNPAAYAAIRARRLMAYMQEIGIRYFVDFDHALDEEYGVFMGEGYPENLQPIGAVASSPYPILGSLRAYRVAGP